MEIVTDETKIALGELGTLDPLQKNPKYVRFKDVRKT